MSRCTRNERHYIIQTSEILNAAGAEINLPKLRLKAFRYKEHYQKYVGAYIAAMSGVDAIALQPV